MGYGNTVLRLLIYLIKGGEDMKELWKDIKGYEGCYQVSNLGRIKSLDRMTNNQYGEYFMKGRILKNSIIKDKGYCRVSLNNGNGKISKRVHRLVAEAFIPNPENKPEVNHKDGNKLNNCVSNLEWCTNKENIEHSIRTGLKKHCNGCSNSSSKFTEEDIIFIRKNYKKRDPMYGGVALARRYSCCPKTIYDIVTKKHYKE
ncbi:MAG: NUMOD4 motif-containing HNH endonuclease [Mollicutes bacterium]|nr:NUMOD4 motif-containing HNH endonuclease [Mollicutes bacterium]